MHRSARDVASGKTGAWGLTRIAYAVEEAEAVTAASCKLSGDTLLCRFFGAVVPVDATLYVSEVESVELLGDIYEAGCSWVVHESPDHEDLAKLALARLERVAEVSLGPGMARTLYARSLFAIPVYPCRLVPQTLSPSMMPSCKVPKRKTSCCLLRFRQSLLCRSPCLDRECTTLCFSAEICFYANEYCTLQ